MDTNKIISQRMNLIDKDIAKKENEIKTLTRELEELQQRKKRLKKSLKKNLKKDTEKYPIKEENSMKLTKLLYESAMLNEMARADLKGAEEALKSKDWEKVAKVYVKNMREKDKDVSSIIRSLGSTFRTKSEDNMVHIGDIKLSKEEAGELKKAIKDEAGFKPAEKKPKKKKEKVEVDVEVDTNKEEKEKDPKMFEEYDDRYYSGNIKKDILNMASKILKK
jgi:hypothetical protein